MRIDFSSPPRIFLLVWVLTLVLHRLMLTTNIVEQNSETWILIMSIAVTMLVINFDLRKYSSNLIVKLCNTGLSKKSEIFDNILFKFWLVGTLIDIYYSRGIPVFWIITSAGKDYTDFGVPSFHGIVNAAYLFIVTSYFAKYLLVKEKKYAIYFWLLMLWPVLMLGRGILWGALMQCLGTYVMIRKIKIINILYLFFIALLFVIVFGEIGNFRSEGNVLLYLITEQSIMHVLPDGFLWVYVYITTGINNIFYSYPSLASVGFPFYSILNLVPSAIKNIFGSFELNESLVQLVDSNLNTSTFLAGYISDFGYLGGVVGTAILAFAARINYRRAKNGNFGYLIGYSIIYQCLIFSPFYDMFFLLPTLFQLLLATIHSNYCR